ncbi:MAG: SPFH domain-containing protein [Methanobrevibacter sp.]|nr:SPFH domain-containing protein [Methanobrevibacter sp.]
MNLDLLKVIKFEGDDHTLVWKHPEEDFNTKSQLIVHESQEAIFFRNGQALDIFGPGKHELKSENIPLLRNLINIPTEGVTPFHCEVYFINKASSLNVEWGTTSKFQVLDPTFNIPINVGASGSMEFIIKDSKKFVIKVVGTQSHVDQSKLVNYFREKISTKVKGSLAKIMGEVSYLVINQRIEDISDALKEKLSEDFDLYGVNLVNFYLSTIFVPKEDTTKLEEILNKKLEYGQLNFNWADEQIAEISKTYAGNVGTGGGGGNGIGGMVAEIPIALAFGAMLKDNMASGLQNQLANKSSSFGSNNQDNIQNNAQNSDTIDTHSNEKFCPKCGNGVDIDAMFCSKCGYKLETELKCDKCGVKVKKEDLFCSKCGNKLKK